MSRSPPLLLLLTLALLHLVLQAEATALRALTDGSSHGEAAVKSESHEAKAEKPKLVSFTGPLIAGVLAIVLIGAVVKFRARTAAN